MKLRFFHFIIIVSILGCSKEVVVEEPVFVTSDIDLFWEVYDSLDGDYSSSVFRESYIDKGTKGLVDYSQQKELPGELVSRLNNEAYRAYYDACRSITLNLNTDLNEIEAAMMKMKDIYPETHFTNTYFLIGALGAGGRVSNNGLLIAVEMFSKPEGFSLESLSEWHQNVIRGNEFLNSIVVHEFIHFQQNLDNSGVLLDQSILEGMADFISKHLLGNAPFFNQHLHDFGDPNEEELWNLFSTQMNGPRSSSEWLYTGIATSQGYPPDMGYYVGYKIVESFAHQYPSTEEAILAMLEINSYNELFQKSNYEDKF